MTTDYADNTDKIAKNWRTCKILCLSVDVS